MYVVLFICECYEIEHMASTQKSLDFFFRKKSENSVEDDVKFVLNNVIKKGVALEEKLQKKHELDCKMTEEKITEWRKDFTFWKTKSGKVRMSFSFFVVSKSESRW